MKRNEITPAERSQIVELYEKLKPSYRQLAKLTKRSIGSLSSVIWRARKAGELSPRTKAYDMSNECECSSPEKRTYRVGRGKGCADCERLNSAHFRGYRSARGENAKRQVTVWQLWEGIKY